MLIFIVVVTFALPIQFDWSRSLKEILEETPLPTALFPDNSHLEGASINLESIRLPEYPITPNPNLYGARAPRVDDIPPWSKKLSYGDKPLKFLKRVQVMEEKLKSLYMPTDLQIEYWGKIVHDWNRLSKGSSKPRDLDLFEERLRILEDSFT